MGALNVIVIKVLVFISRDVGGSVNIMIVPLMLVIL